MGSLVRRVGAVTVGVAVLVLLPVAAADAHVRVTPDSAAAGSSTGLSFRVPTESATASTTGLRITLPQDHPFTSVSVRPLAGWTAEMVTDPLPAPVEVNGATITKAVHTVTWTAQPGAAVGPGQYQEFQVRVGPLPTSGQVVIPASQTYSDGTVVDWDQVAKAGAAEPEHPAPAFTVTAADPTGAAAAPGAASGSSDGGDALARWLGGAGLAVGVVALASVVPVSRRLARR